MTIEHISTDFRKRNALRLEVGLPALDEKIEITRELAVERSHAFEIAFRHHRQQIAGEWSNKNDGWLSRAGRYSLVRSKFRAEFESSSPV